ncbi:MAG: hypothetical protein ACT4QG_03645 [Sporichthyaceae bacterium]
MSEARTALVRLHAALDAHLDAVEKKSGENDPAVQATFLELREACTDYDEALFDDHDEVTPFDLPPLPDDEEDDDDSYGPRITVLARWDFSIADPARLVAAASEALGSEVDDPAVAATLLAHMGSRSGLGTSAAAADAGLLWHGTVTATVPCDYAEPDAEWMEEAFAEGVEPEDVLCIVSDVPDLAPAED